MNTKCRNVALSVLAISFCAVSAAFGNGGVIDNTFFQSGTIDDAIYAVASDPLTNIVIAGHFEHVYGQPALGIAVLSSTGQLISVPTNSDFVRGCLAVAMDSESRIYAGGDDRYCRFIPQGTGWTLDTTFGAPTYTGNLPLGNVSSIALRPLDNQQFVASYGTMYSIDVMGNGSINPVGPSGLLQLTYVPPGSAGDVTFLEHLVAVGAFGVGDIAADGEFLSGPFTGYGTFNCAAERSPGASYSCSSPYGDITAGGEFFDLPTYNNNYPTEYGGYINRLGGIPNAGHYFNDFNTLTNRSQDSGYSICAMVAFDGGDILVGGDFTKIHGVSVQNLAHLNANGTVDYTFPGSSFTVTSITQQHDGKYLIAGFDEYTPLTGWIYRMSITETTAPPAITEEPADVSVLEGDSACLVAGYSGSPTPSAYWTKDGSPYAGGQGSEICFEPAYATNEGAYQMVVEPFCGDNLYSRTAQLTVIPVPPPVNDSFSSAIALSGTAASSSSSLRKSTFQTSERDPTGYLDGHSVWWTWTSPITGTATVDLSGDGSPVMAVYSGTSLVSLQDITNNVIYNCYPDPDGGEIQCHFGGFAASTTFTVTNGITYQFQVGGQVPTGTMGNVDLSLTAQAVFSAPPNAWTPAAPPTTNDLYCVASSGTMLVAAGEAAEILTSPDAASWTEASTGLDPTNEFDGIAYGNGMFVAVGIDGLVDVSANGTTWTSGNANILPSDWLNSVIFVNGVFVAVGDEGTVATSTDGLDWTTQTNGAAASFSDSLWAVTYASGQFVAVGDNSTIITSPDGTNWVAQNSGLTNGTSFYGVSGGNGAFIAFGNDVELFSTDGVNWAAPSNPFDYPDNLAFGNGRFVAFDYDDDIFTSIDGQTWITDLTPNINYNDEFYAATYFRNGQWVLVGEQGLIISSWPDQIPAFASSKNQIQFAITGLTGTTVVIELATQLNPPNWQPVSTNQIVNGSVVYTDTTQLPAGFYRAVYQ